MARHTLQGDWPIFFYGQSYMGSLDATLIAAAFALFGQSVLVVRLAQTVLFIGVVITTYLLAVRFYGDRWTAGAAAMLVALPTVLVSTYTTATLGGYGEIVVKSRVELPLSNGTVLSFSAQLSIGARRRISMATCSASAYCPRL